MAYELRWQRRCTHNHTLPFPFFLSPRNNSRRLVPSSSSDLTHRGEEKGSFRHQKNSRSSNLCTVQHEMRDGRGKTRRNYGDFLALNGATPDFLGPIFRIFLFPPLHLVPNYLLFLPPPSVRPSVQPCPRSSSQEKRRL